eukprot:2237788-Prorocentrum_lima.AAC.1
MPGHYEVNTGKFTTQNDVLQFHNTRRVRFTKDNRCINDRRHACMLGPTPTLAYRTNACPQGSNGG